MNLYELEAFCELAKTLHFTRTAEKVNVSPSALSRMISRLEEETGSQLFERDNRAVVLTKDGKIFAEFARNCLDNWEDLQAALAGKSTAVSGTLHVYASVTACYSIVPPFLKKLSETYPDIHLSIETGDPALAPAAVRSGRSPPRSWRWKMRTFHSQSAIGPSSSSPTRPAARRWPSRGACAGRARGFSSKPPRTTSCSPPATNARRARR